MTVPLILLAIPSAFLGLVFGWPPESGLIHRWLQPVFEEAEAVLGHRAEAFQLYGIDGYLIGGSVAVALVGMIVAWWLFGFRVPLIGLQLGSRPRLVERLTARLRPLYIASYRKWWFDDLNDLLFVRIGGGVARVIWWFDVHVVDGLVNAVGRWTQGAGREVRQVQTGRVQNYALGIALGLLVIAISYLSGIFAPR
jgi:NADH-quinone oxidoreductase subunit L